MSIIISERLIFKTLTEDDVSPRYVDWLNDREVNQFLETRFASQSFESCRKFVSEMNNDPLSHLFGIFDRKSHGHIGNIKLGFINTHHLTGQLSLLLGEKSCWGRGYATESIRCITKWGFDDLGLERVEAGCYDTNLGSLRAFLKAEYVVEGYLRRSVSLDGRRVGAFLLGILRTHQDE